MTAHWNAGPTRVEVTILSLILDIGIRNQICGIRGKGLAELADASNGRNV